MPHQFPVRVYYEDTDLAGIVYYANYLKFIERARSEYLRALGVDQVALKAERGFVFAVRRVEADYFLPAVFDDDLSVVTTPKRISGARVVLQQDVMRGGTRCFGAVVTIVALGGSRGPARIPADVRQAMENAPA